MRLLWLLLACSTCGFAQHQLYAAGSNAKGFVVGAPLGPSGVFRRLPSGEWRHIGFNHPFAAAVADSGKPDLLYLAAGNGLIQLTQNGERWKILTGSDVTELTDVAIAPRTKAVYFSHTRGIAASFDAGATWRDISGDLKHRYTESIRVDRENPNALLAATEAGVFRSLNGGAHWDLAGAAGFQTLRVEQSPTNACYWLATTELGGIFVSRDCAKTFESLPGRVGVDRSLYALAWDPLTPHRVAAAGFNFGVALSNDDGLTWAFRNSGLSTDRVWSVIFDPDRKDRMFASVHEEAVFASDDAGITWTSAGLPGSVVHRFTFAAAAK